MSDVIPVALFVRVSTPAQDYTRQVSDLTAVANKQGYHITHIIAETGSATKRLNVDRPEVEFLLTLCRAKTIRKVLVTEFSRLGRRRSETPALMPGRRCESHYRNRGVHLRPQSWPRDADINW